MGWAARAKRKDWQDGKSVARGNPEPVQRRARVIAQDQFDAAMKKQEGATAAFSDRVYDLDAHGTLHRRPPAVPTFTVKVTRTELEPELSA